MRRSLCASILLAAALLAAAACPDPSARAEGDAKNPAPSLRLVYAEGFAPYSWSEEGRSLGVLPEIAAEACRRAGIDAFHEVLPWPAAQDKVRRMAADGFISLATPERLAYAEAGREPVLVTVTGLYTGVRYEPLTQQLRETKGVADLKAYVFADYEGDSWGRTHLEGFQVRTAPTLAEALRLLARGDAQLFAQNPEVTDRAIARLGLAGKVMRVPGVFLDELRFHFLVNKYGGALRLLPALDEALAGMRADGTLAAILAAAR